MLPNRSAFLPLLLFCTGVLLAAPCLASHSSPVIALHAKAHTSKGVTICSTWAPNDIDCTQFITAGQTGVSYDVYVVGVLPISIAGVRWAIDYDGAPQRGVDVFNWTGCGDGEYPWADWPKPRTGNTLTWTISSDPALNTCQDNEPGNSGVQAVAGAFYLYAYSDDVFSIAPFYGWLTENGQWVGWQDPILEMADCGLRSYGVDLESGRGAVRFSAGGTAIGFNPCTGEGELPPFGPPDPPITPPSPPPPGGEHKATVLLHVGIAGDRGGSCSDAPSALDSVKTSAPYSMPGTLYDVYLLATPKVPNDPVGIGVIQVGIEYSPSLQVQSWISCGAQVPFNNWPASSSGNTLVFEGCESGEIEVAGYFRVAVYDPSLFRIIGHPLTGLAKMADCTGEGVLEDLSQAQVGWISLGGAAIGQDADGCNPVLESCAPGPVRAHQTTWGKLKSKY